LNSTVKDFSEELLLANATSIFNYSRLQFKDFLLCHISKFLSQSLFLKILTWMRNKHQVSIGLGILQLCINDVISQTMWLEHNFAIKNCQLTFLVNF